MSDLDKGMINNQPNELELMRLLQSVWTAKKTDKAVEIPDDESLLAEIWDSLDHAETLAEPLPDKNFTESIKLIVSQIAKGFAFENLGNLVPLAITPFPALRSDAKDNLITSASFRFAQKNLPGAIFYLAVKAETEGLTFSWQVAGNPGRVTRISMYSGSRLLEMQSLVGGSADFFDYKESGRKVSFFAEGQKNLKIPVLTIEL